MNIKSSLVLPFIVLSFLVATLQAQAQSSSSSGNDADSETEIQDNSQESSSDSAVKEVVVGDDELPSESVTPITDNKSNVLNKKIKFTKRFQFDFGTGTILDEAILNANYFMLRGSYFSNEEYSFGLGIKSRFGGKTSYAEQLLQKNIHFEVAPAPTQSEFISFGYNFYYGKISLGKNLVIPASTKVQSDFGLQTFGSSSKPFIQSAINQSFFINGNLSVGVSFGLILAQIADPTSVNIKSTPPSLPANISESSFSNKMQFNEYLSVNLNVLL